MNRSETLAAYAYEYLGSWSLIADALRRGQEPRRYEIREPYLTIYDKEYPDSLRRLRFPPWVIFWRGNPDLLKEPGITVVGSRQMNAYGREMTVQIASRLREKFVLVSGLARGVDAQVHRTALAGGKTIGVIGSGLSTHYPRCNAGLYEQMAGSHLILSEYPCFVPVRREHFPWRNRILAALGQQIIVTQARCKSGTMLTVNEAVALGKDVWCVPWPLVSPEGEGCNQLIAQGALILASLEQLEDIRPRPRRA